MNLQIPPMMARADKEDVYQHMLGVLLSLTFTAPPSKTLNRMPCIR